MERPGGLENSSGEPEPESVQEKFPCYEAKETKTTMIASAGMLLASLAGAAILAWWALEFHRANEQLWMVPVGLVMLGTPIVAWFSVAASDAGRRLELLLCSSVAAEEAAALDPEK